LARVGTQVVVVQEKKALGTEWLVVLTATAATAAAAAAAKLAKLWCEVVGTSETKNPPMHSHPVPCLCCTADRSTVRTSKRNKHQKHKQK